MPSEQRLHPASMLFSFGKSLKAFAVPGLVGLRDRARRPGPNFDGWLMLMLIPAAIVAIVRYLSFRLHYEGTELVIRSGILFRNERHIPFARIQNLDAVQNVFHRLLRVIEVRVQTGAGNEPEAIISVLPASALDEMRSRVFARDLAAPETPGVAARPLLELPFRELLLHGFLVNRGMVVIAAVYGLLWELGVLSSLWEPVLGDEAAREGMVRDLLGTMASGRTLSLLQIAVAARRRQRIPDRGPDRLDGLGGRAPVRLPPDAPRRGPSDRLRPVHARHRDHSAPAHSVGDDSRRSAVPAGRSRLGPRGNGRRASRAGGAGERARMAGAAHPAGVARDADCGSTARARRGQSDRAARLAAASSAGVSPRGQAAPLPGSPPVHPRGAGARLVGDGLRRGGAAVERLRGPAVRRASRLG